MIVIQSFKNFIELLLAPFLELFRSFPELGSIITGILTLSLGYFGWRAVK